MDISKINPKDNKKSDHINAPLNIQTGVCPGCDGTEFKFFHVPARDVSISICTHCGLYINNASVSAEEAADTGTYDADYHYQMYGKSAVRKIRSSLFHLQLLSQYVVSGKFLDIGSSLGYTVSAAQKAGWEAHGVDISIDAVNMCQKAGLNVIEGDMQHLNFPDDNFDLINLRHVLEHDVELWACLAEIRRVLKPGGILLVEVPCVECRQVSRQKERYLKFWHPCHCYWFTKESLRNILKRAGYREVPIPLYGKGIFSRGLLHGAQFLIWRTHLLLKRSLGQASYDTSAWIKEDLA